MLRQNKNNMEIENPPIHIILHNPEIPQNTGSIGRLAAILNARLHLIHPLGFIITDARLRRAGMDYWYDLDVVHHASWEDFKKSDKAPRLDRIWLLTTKAKDASVFNAKFEFGDGLVFGSEGSGVPQFLHDELSARRITIPQPNPKLRSLNLAMAAGIAAYTACRSFGAL